MATLQKYKDQALAGEQELAAATERVEAAEAEAKRYDSIRVDQRDGGSLLFLVTPGTGISLDSTGQKKELN